MNRHRPSMVAGVLVLTLGCAEPNLDVSDALTTTSAALTVDQGFGTTRVIPIRFVQFTDGSNPGLTAANLDEQVSAMNDVFGPAGIQFTIRQVHEVAGSVFTDTSTSEPYVWPTVGGGTTPPPLAFNPGCAMPRPAGGSEPEETALFRAGSYCAFDGEILIYTIAVRSPGGQSHGAYPWEANAVIMQRPDMGTGNRTLAHEVGHYLALPHVFKGASGGYDLGNPNCRNPQTNTPSNLSDFWDLVYKPGTARVAHTFFNSRAAAAAVESSLVQIQNETTDGSICVAGGTPACPAGTVDGTLRVVVDTTASRSETHYTGDNAMKGLGFSFTSGTPRGVNVMSYNYPAPSATRFSVSAAQIEQLGRTFTYDTPSDWFPGTTGRRPLLGLGQGTWTAWESLGGSTTDVPQPATHTAGRIDLVVRGSDGSVYNKVLQSNGWWPSQTGWTSMGGSALGSPALGVRANGDLDVVVRGTDNAVYFKTWDASTGWLPSQTGWTSLGGSVADAPLIGERSTGEVDVVVLGSDSNAYNKVWSASGGWWPSQTNWSGIGGPATTTPTLLELANGQMEVERQTSDGHVADKQWTASGGWAPSQSGWSDIGSSVAATPAATSWGTGRMDLVARATDGTVENKVWQGSWWPSTTGWASMGGNTLGRPSIVSWGSGRLDVVARSADGTVLYKSWTTATGWWPSQLDWAVLGGSAGSDPVLATWGTGRLDVFVRGTDGAVWHRARVQ